MEGWQRKAREEREFLSCRFREAKALVERLAQENQVLLGKLNHNSSLLGSCSKTTLIETGSQIPDPDMMRNGLPNSQEVTKTFTKSHKYHFLSSFYNDRLTNRSTQGTWVSITDTTDTTL